MKKKLLQILPGRNLSIINIDDKSSSSEPMQEPEEMLFDRVNYNWKAYISLVKGRCLMVVLSGRASKGILNCGPFL